MDITPEQARQSLDAIDEAQTSVQKVFERQSGRIVFGWGIAYFLGPLAMHLMGNSGLLVQQLSLIAAIGFMIYECSTKAIASGTGSRNFGISWGVLYGFGLIWFLVLTPWNWTEIDNARATVISKQMWAYGVTLAMFAYTLMGLWMDRIYLWMGLSVTAAVLIGQYFLPESYWLWCAFTNGGILILGAIVLLRRANAR